MAFEFLHLLFRSSIYACIALGGVWAVLTFITERKAAAFRKQNPQITTHAQWLSYTNLLVRFGIIPARLLKFKGGWSWDQKFEPFANSELGAVALVTPTETTVHIASADLVREATSKFPKPLHYYGLLNIFGKNVVTVEGAEWKRHRRIAAPQFSEKNNRLVHTSTVTTASDMFSSWDSASVAQPGEEDRSTKVDVGQDMTKLALLVISGAGFGLPLDWEGEGNLQALLGKDSRHNMSYKASLEIVVEYLTLYLILPRWIYWIPSEKLRKIKSGFDEFKSYMTEFVQSSRVRVKNGADTESNLLSSLVQAAASDKSDGEGGLSESEILGNIFILLFAGHETTAGTLQYTLSVLAIHREKQEKLYDEVTKVIGENNYPSYSDYNNLTYCQAIMNEVLRLYPPVLNIPKWTGDKSMALGPLNLNPGTYLDITVAALHHNPKHWGSDHNEFKPERFLPTATNKPDRYAFAPFSEGGRMCLGKKFSQVEFVCALAMISKRYTWKLAPGARPEDVLESVQIITMRPKNRTSLVFTKRPNCGDLPTKAQAKAAGAR